MNSTKGITQEPETNYIKVMINDNARFSWMHIVHRREWRSLYCAINMVTKF